MEENSIYGNHREAMEAVLNRLLEMIDDYRRTSLKARGEDPVDHILARIKSEESMREKCRRNELPENTASALGLIHDAIGIRVVCPFLDDVYDFYHYLEKESEVEIVTVKDYIRDVKPNGYRSLHIIVRLSGYFAEIQVRTVSQDTWAALEHQIKYKKNVRNTDLIVSELKRCADELASTDISMQTIRDMIRGEEGFKE